MKTQLISESGIYSYSYQLSGVEIRELLFTNENYTKDAEAFNRNYSFNIQLYTN